MKINSKEFECTELKLKPQAKGLLKVLGRTEHEVMEYLWSNGKSTIREVSNQLKEHREISHTTVQTTMTRMARKNLLKVEMIKKTGCFYPAISREQLIDCIVRLTIDSLFTDYPEIVKVYCQEYSKNRGCR